MNPTRRSLFRMGIAGVPAFAAAAPANRIASNTVTNDQRLQTALQIRMNAAQTDLAEPFPAQVNNGDETAFPNYIANFSKGLPHLANGEVDPAAYVKLISAINSGLASDYAAITPGFGTAFVDPMAGYAYEMQGLDSHAMTIPAAPSFSSAEMAAEMVELYWQAMARDIPFANYDRSLVIQRAAQDLAKLPAYSGPKNADGSISTSQVFRSTLPGALAGPYISQFFLRPIPMNSTWVEQKYRVPLPGTDFLTAFDEWLLLQGGLPPYRQYVFDSTPRYMNTGRAIAEWVHYDFLYQGFHNAALILMNSGPESILTGSKYWSPNNPYKGVKNMSGFSTFGAPHVCGMLGEVTIAALHAAWFQKWMVHRRQRPEEFAGRVHQVATGAAKYPISQELLNSDALARSYQLYGSYLLPQAFPEGAPLHPAYPAGHATVAGACSALLKAFFDENALLTDNVVASADGLSLQPLNNVSLTVGGEINKLAFNIAMGRNFAGIHYRSDMSSGFRLGEDVTISILRDSLPMFDETFTGFQFTRLDGTPVQIMKSSS
ncbi:MAG: vanadium-dependent haloperoxidase [Acidobacteriaceae bacterium]|nr:vanadium-dependent haloperoxidase [Acidobacteriaceae bacterium]